MFRYKVVPVSDEHCDSVNTDPVLFETDSLLKAVEQAPLLSASYCYGVAVVDRMTGEVDYGYGFGVPCPDMDKVTR